MIAATARRVSTPKGGLCGRGLRAELRRQPVGGGCQDFWTGLQGLDRYPPYRARNAERADRLAGEILHRDRDAADLEIIFAVVERDSAAADVLDLAHQHRNLGDGFFRRRFELHPLEEPFELIRVQRCEDHL